MSEIIEVLERSIFEKLPQVPYTLDLIGEALKWKKEVCSEGEYIKKLKGTLDFCDYVHSISEGNFYRSHLVIAFILFGTPGVMQDERFNAFKTTSGAVEDALIRVTLDEESIKTRGFYRTLLMAVTKLGKENEEYMAILNYHILTDLQEIAAGMTKVSVKTPITKDDSIKVLGYALVMANLRMSNLHLLDTTKSAINEIEILLNSNFNY